MRIPAGGGGLIAIAQPAETKASSGKLHAIVAGAGIGGLTAALALARAGLRVTVLERTAVIEEIGAGLQLSPNCSGILREYGVLDRLDGCALVPEALDVRRARDGAELMRMPLGVIAEMRWGAPYLLALRGDLQRALVEQIAREPSISVETDTNVAGFAASSEGVEVGAKRGGASLRLVGDLLIGADGLHSLVRERIGLGLSDVPLYSGHTAWRALLDAGDAPPEALRLETSLWLGHKAHLVHYPLRGGSIVNVVAVTEDSWRGAEAGDFWSAAGDAAALVARFGRWHGRSASPHRGGAGMAPLAAVRPPSGDALDVFARRAARRCRPSAAAFPRAGRGPGDRGCPRARPGLRRPRRGRRSAAILRARTHGTCGAVQAASRRQGRIYHLPAPAAQVRDFGMRMLGAAGMLARYDWLYQYHT